MKTSEGLIDYSAPQIAGREEPFRSEIRAHLTGRTQALEDLALELLARDLSVRNIDDTFRDEEGRLLLSKTARHGLFHLAGLIDWAGFDVAFGRSYRKLGRPGTPTRLMVGLSYLKHSFDLSDEEVVARWVENPYWQHFCGFEYFQHELAIDPSSMSRWCSGGGDVGGQTSPSLRYHSIVALIPVSASHSDS